MIDFTLIRERLAARPPQLDSTANKRPAAVALILCEQQLHPGLELLFIERACHPQDPWSGNLAFPGGRVDPGDAGTKAAAERETREEIDLDLQEAEYLGQLDDITGAYLPVRISCHLYALGSRRDLTINHEVKRWFWFPVEELLDSQRHTTSEIFWHGESRKIRGITLLGPGEPLLWGITYRLVMQFLVRLGRVDEERLLVIDD